MIPVQRVTVSVVVTVVLGGSAPACGRLSGDARGDAASDAARSTEDARADQQSPKDAGSTDAGAAEGGRLDARAEGGADARSEAALVGATTLSISPLTLEPSFSTAIHDYYVRCAAGTNTLTVSMTAAPGSAIGLMKPITTSASTGQSATLSVAENDAIVVGLTTGGTTDPYWIRCLPHDFPKLQLTLHPDAGTPTAGYYLVGNMTAAKGKQGYAAALDGNGVPVWYHATSTGQPACDVENLVPGTISFAGFAQAPLSSSSGQFELHDLLTGTTTYVEPSGMPLDPHELRVLSNGDYLLFADPVTTGVNLTGLGSFGANESMLECDIQEVDPTGAVVWQWTATDHFDPVKDSLSPETNPAGGVTVVDPFHCNSIDVDSNGDLLVSAADMSSIFLVSRATGAVLWKMGGAKYTKDDAQYIAVENDPQTSFYRQHDARFLSDGTVSMFDDQTGKAGPARAVIYSYDADAGTATPAWQYQGTSSSGVMGGFRISSDGSRVIGWGMNESGFRAFTEVDVNGNDLLDFSFPDGNTTYRAVKVPTSAFDINILRASAGTS